MPPEKVTWTHLAVVRFLGTLDTSAVEGAAAKNQASLKLRWRSTRNCCRSCNRRKSETSVMSTFKISSVAKICSEEFMN
jgi:hypothetical protein